MTTSRRHFWHGARDSLPIVASAAPFGLLFGALAVDNGLSIGETVLMSAMLYAGASQMVGIELFGAHVAPWLVVFSVFAVNFRHVLYSAALGRKMDLIPGWRKAVAFFFLVDPQFAAAETRYEVGKPLTFAWYMGLAVPIYIFWVLEAWAGALFGNLIAHPEAIGLDFVLSIYFLGLVLGFRKRANWLPVVIASGLGSILAYWLVGSPWHVSLGALVGVCVAVLLPLKPDDPVADAAEAPL
ncbi:AzlC family ABC transporter permease [Hoeflea sp.]|uniref:AzlC family ABC transporter permease n=1 Tax=Hoeflea sp. TaxID=1940281 RepID=UPI002AFE68CD|nr:AzlC family ABC transporter permease [Hoeflea sp.]